MLEGTQPQGEELTVNPANVPLMSMPHPNFLEFYDPEKYHVRVGAWDFREGLSLRKSAFEDWSIFTCKIIKIQTAAKPVSAGKEPRNRVQWGQRTSDLSVDC